MALKSSKDIEKALRNIMEQVVEEVSNRLYKTLRDCIQETIYSGPEGWYKRHTSNNGGFIDAFELEDLKRTSLKITKEIVYNYMKMALWDNWGYTHGYDQQYIDRRKDLYWILDNEEFNVRESEFKGIYYWKDHPGAPGYFEIFNAMVSSKIWTWVREAIKKTGAKT